ncbi:hypothetical protein DEVEQU_00729 [Devosia equisanguinis]|uniref:Uncharacterized protein n=2 Tax=Devosia equisanguinis TaxID=2490941 RepID=A0A3S4CBT9_9HYPH|nr:hypothetical protein DEVEQU_00729 [Devosia equisanguinis]
MSLLLTKLAETLDGWSDDGRALITETETVLVAARLSAVDTHALVELAATLTWAVTIEDRSGDYVQQDYIDDDFGPFKVLVSKPPTSDRVNSIVTNAGFADWLSRAPATPAVQVVRLTGVIETLAVRMAPWGDDDTSFVPTRFPANPRKVVREFGGHRVVPEYLGPWVMADTSDLLPDDKAATVWINSAATMLMMALANELEDERTLVFRGPPLAKYLLPAPGSQTFDHNVFRHLQDAGRWVFEFEQEMETRHALMASELARTNVGSGDAAALFSGGTKSGLEGAKIAHQLGLHKISMDSLKAMADLRKAVADEATKLADATRQLAAAVATALFAGVGVITARLTVPMNGPIVTTAVVVLAVVLCLYVGAVILSGWQFVRIQSDLRLLWRSKLYRFLPKDDYEALVSGPAGRAERGFKTAAWIGGGLAATLLASVLVVAFFGPAAIPLGVNTSSNPAEPVSDIDGATPPEIDSRTEGSPTRSTGEEGSPKFIGPPFLVNR